MNRTSLSVRSEPGFQERTWSFLGTASFVHVSLFPCVWVAIERGFVAFSCPRQLSSVKFPLRPPRVHCLYQASLVYQ